MPPRSRRKAPQGTRATAILELWTKLEGENREFLRDLELEGKSFLLVELGLGLVSEEPLWKEEKEGALVEVDM